MPTADIVTCSTEVEPVSPTAVPPRNVRQFVIPTCFKGARLGYSPHNALSLTQKSRHPGEEMAPATDFILAALAQEGSIIIYG